MFHRIKCIDLGRDEVYNDYVENELTLANDYLGMSKLTRRILASINYEYVKEQRIKNYKVLFTNLQRYNPLDINFDSTTPMVYPILVKDISIINYLQDKNIIAINWWNQISNMFGCNNVELALSQKIIQLPIDQRYDEKDMDYISNVVMRRL